MVRWKASVEFLLRVIELLFLSYTVQALQGKMCQTSLPSGEGRSLGGKISGRKGRPPDFSFCIVEIVQKTTNLGTSSPFWGS